MIEKLKGKLDITFLKFVLVGVVNTVVGTAVMFLAYNLLHLSYWVSSAANYIVGSICSYFLNKYFTFQNKSKSPVVMAGQYRYGMWHGTVCNPELLWSEILCF